MPRSVTRLIVIAAAVLLALAGVAATFAPEELLAFLGSPATGALPVLVQLLGALWLGFAMMNWMAKDSSIGGIYNRPLVIGNLVHFVVGAFALGRFAFSGDAPVLLLVLAGVYAIFAVAFGKML